VSDTAVPVGVGHAAVVGIPASGPLAAVVPVAIVDVAVDPELLPVGPVDAPEPFVAPSDVSDVADVSDVTDPLALEPVLAPDAWIDDAVALDVLPFDAPAGWSPVDVVPHATIHEAARSDPMPAIFFMLLDGGVPAGNRCPPNRFMHAVGESITRPSGR
jgi:hypothetical protein